MSEANDDIAYEDDPPHPRRYSYQGGGKFDGVIKTIGVALIIAGILGFVGMVFAFNGAISNLRETQAVHANSLQFLSDQMAEVKAEQRQIRGRVYRSDGTLAGDFSADQPQP